MPKTQASKQRSANKKDTVDPVRPKSSKVVAKKQQTTVTRSKSGQRLLQVPKRVWYRPLTWRHHLPTPTYVPLPKARVLFWRVLTQLWAHKRLFGGIVLTYGLLNLVLVRGLAGSNDLSTLKAVLNGAFHGAGGKFVSGTISFAYLLANSGSGSTTTSGVYQTILLILCSLAFIWALRETLAERSVRIRDSFYRGMHPLVPFLLLFLLLGVQLLPLVIGSNLYSTVISNGIAVHFWEKALWLLLFIVLCLWSLRMITVSIFALYIVTLPGMTPMKAYRNARQLVYRRRLAIWRKLIFLPVVLLLLAGLIEIPLILFATSLAIWTFFILSMLALPIVHGYLYNLYRDML